MERTENITPVQAPEQTPAEKPLTMKKKSKVPVSRIVIFAILVLYTFLLFFPLYTVVVTSFTSMMESSSTTQFVWLPKHPTFDSYVSVFTKDINAEYLGVPSLLVGFWNTLWITLLPLVVGLLVSGLSAYAYTKMKFPGKEKLFSIAFIISMIPLGAFGVISYTFYSMIGWTGTTLPLIIPGMFGSMGTVFFLKMYYEGVPDSYIEAARMDGLGSLGAFFVIVFPLAGPAFIAQFIFGFVGGYNNYLGPLLYLQGDPDYITLQLVLSQVTTLFPGEGQETVHCAAAILGMIPLIVIYAFLQKYFIEGIAVGGVKD